MTVRDALTNEVRKVRELLQWLNPTAGSAVLALERHNRIGEGMLALDAILALRDSLPAGQDDAAMWKGRAEYYLSQLEQQRADYIALSQPAASGAAKVPEGMKASDDKESR